MQTFFGAGPRAIGATAYGYELRPLSTGVVLLTYRTVRKEPKHSDRAEDRLGCGQTLDFGNGWRSLMECHLPVAIEPFGRRKECRTCTRCAVQFGS
jgi:hypothetical protein